MPMPATILVTGGAGFIGGCFVRLLVGERAARVLNLDKLTYAGNLSTLRDVDDDPRMHFVKGDICDPGPLEDPGERVALVQHRQDDVGHAARQ